MQRTWAIAFSLLTAGCLGAAPDDPGGAGNACPTADAFWLPEGARSNMEVDGTLRSDLLAYVHSSPNVRIDSLSLPPTWTWESETFAADTMSGSLVRVGITPAGGAAGSSPGPGTSRPVTLNLSTAPSPGCVPSSTSHQWHITFVNTDRHARPGDGVAVWYAGFWLNGTLFSTNMVAVDASAWPRAGWYQSSAGAPLNVYVYDKDRSEMQPQWSTPRDPRTNQSVAWSYSTTIEGFNAALKGLSTGASRVTVIPPEKAYTQPGREKHALYGDALVFYIDVVEIVDVPCPPQVTMRSLCRTPQGVG